MNAVAAFRFCFADIWQNEIDGAWAYRKLYDAEESLGSMLDRS